MPYLTPFTFLPSFLVLQRSLSISLSLCVILLPLHKSLSHTLLQHTCIPTSLYSCSMHTANSKKQKPCFFYSLPCMSLFPPFSFFFFFLGQPVPSACRPRIATLLSFWAKCLIPDPSDWPLIKSCFLARQQQQRINRRKKRTNTNTNTNTPKLTGIANR